jgi:hypothetical protein
MLSFPAAIKVYLCTVVVRQNFSRNQKRTVLGRVVIASIQQEESGTQEPECARVYI